MKDEIYTIKRLCKELDQPRQKIRRRLIKFNITAINKDTRVYKNEPLEYDYQTFLRLAEEFNISANDTKRTENEQQYSTVEQECTTENEQRTTDYSTKNKLIKTLEEQLKESNKSRENLERLLDQQQQLTLMSNRKIEALKLELQQSNEEKELEDQKEKKETKEEKIEDKKRKKWWGFFRG